MFNDEMLSLGCKRSAIRELFEFGKQRAAEVGADKVYDFSLGNPSVPAPAEVKEAMLELINTLDDKTLHGYTSAQGDLSVRTAVADSLNKKYGVSFGADDIYMTCGAAAGLAITLRALCIEGDEVVLLAPYFPEYGVFVKAAGATPVTVKFDGDFQIDFASLEEAISPKTKAIIVNSPNNPCGVIYSEKTLKKLGEMLTERAKLYGHPLFIIADEPYRELVYDGENVPFIPTVYGDTVVCYSFSKSLSLPGERIGYIAVNPACNGARELYFAILGAGRALGYVCAPSLFQRVAAKCLDARPDLKAYDENRTLLYTSLCKIGFECVHPKGAFYLFVKAPNGDAAAFSEAAKKHGLLIVSGDDFAAPEWVRIAYCVSKDTILKSLPSFEKLYSEFV